MSKRRKRRRRKSNPWEGFTTFLLGAAVVIGILYVPKLLGAKKEEEHPSGVIDGLNGYGRYY